MQTASKNGPAAAAISDVEVAPAQSAGRWESVCSVADVSEDAGKKVDVEGFPSIAIFKIGEQFHAIADLCTHGAASLSEGFVENGIIECPFHSGTFDIKTGMALTFPCTEAVSTYPVRVEGDRLLILLDIALPPKA